MMVRLIAACAVLMLIGMAPVNAGQGGADSWTPREMGDPGQLKGKALKLPFLPEDRSFPAEFRCKEKASSCEFELAYFLGDGFDLSKKQRLSILYIPGGPGAIVDPSNRSAALRLLEAKHNVVYFHPRGVAKSAIDGDRLYDQFLRADYVANDIERLRQELLKSRPWDAIYGHSWGTVIAQRYAAKYAQAKDPNPKVRSLILTGPVDRHRASTQKARAETIVENFKLIVTYYRTQGAGKCQCESPSYLKSKVTDFSAPQIGMVGDSLEASDNFCFLTDKLIDDIVGRLRKVVATIDQEFGSADFIVDNFQALKKDKEFQSRFSRFPIEFFAAVRYLQMSGAPEKDGLVFVADSRSRVNAAFIIAHDLMETNAGSCNLKDPIFSDASGECYYCDRLKAAREKQREQIGGRESERGSYVFGVYDGVTRWLPVMMGTEGCFTGKDIGDFAKRTGAGKEFGRDQAKKIGVVSGEKVCPWNPTNFRHEVPTLLVKGSRDAVVAGCQAEDFLVSGLKDGRRVLLELRGMGHDLSVSNLYGGLEVSPWSKRFAGLLEDFIKLSPNVAKFRADNSVRANLEKLKASDRTRDPNLASRCGKS